MAFSFSRSQPSPIAIDFGARRIKLLQVVPGDPPQLVAAASAVVPGAARDDASGRSAAGGVVDQAVRRLLSESAGRFKGRRAVLSFPAFQALMQHLEVGKVEGKGLESRVAATLEQRLEIDPARMVIRHFPVRQVAREGRPLEEVICLAAGRDVIMGYIDIARRCKLDVVGVHAEPVAMLRAFEHLYRTSKDWERVTCYIDIGAATTKVVIAHGRRMRFAKSIHAGGDRLSPGPLEETQEADDAAVVEPVGGAALSDVDGGIGVSGAGVGGAVAVASAKSQAASQASAASGADAREAMQCIVDELGLCLRYHRKLFPDKEVEKLVFLGGASCRTATCQAIARTLRMPAQVGEPFATLAGVEQPERALGVDLTGPQPGWAVPMGLCLSEVNG